MNLYYANNIIIEKTENLALLGKSINKIFYTSKIKKQNIPNKTLSTLGNLNIDDLSKITSKEINLYFCSSQKNKNIVVKDEYKPNKLTKTENEKNNLNESGVGKKNKKDKKNNKFLNKNKVNEQKNKNNNSLIRPIFAEEDHEEKNIFTNKGNFLNPININIKNNFKVNTIFNNFIFNDFQKNSGFINNNLKFSFNNLSKYPLTRFENIPFSNSEDFFKNNKINFQLSSNIGNNINSSGINTNNLKKKEKFNISLGNSSSKDTTLEKNKIVFLGGLKKKGRRSKNLKNLNIPSKHTKFSPDNMMRKIKNKIIESSRLLCNKILENEIKNLKELYQSPYTEFKKIKGSFSQELNIKFNLWFYQIKIKEIFSMEISTKYSSFEKSSNKELIEYIFSKENINNFHKLKELLNMPFHLYYHDIFLGERKDWIIYYGIEENKYELNYLLNSLEEEDKNNNLNKIYVEKLGNLAKNYEGFFLFKKMRNVDLSDKKNDFIKQFMNNSLESDYLKYLEQVKQIKNFYDNRQNMLQNNIDNKDIIEEKQNDVKNEDILNNIIISIGEEKNQLLGKKRNPAKLSDFN